MDERVRALIDDLESNRIARADGSLDSESLRDRIVALHREVGDEQSRLRLIELHNALMSTSERRLIEQGRDPEPLRAVWRQDYFGFIVAEAVGADGEIDPARLAALREREVAAGRLDPDECLHIERAEPEPEAEPHSAPQSELERAYRALIRWDEEKMKPRIEALASEYRAQIAAIAADPGPTAQEQARETTIEYGRWFDDHRENFLAEAVSYLDSETISGLRELGVDRQFGEVILDSIEESAQRLISQMAEAREDLLGSPGEA